MHNTLCTRLLSALITAGIACVPAHALAEGTGAASETAPVAVEAVAQAAPAPVVEQAKAPAETAAPVASSAAQAKETAETKAGQAEQAAAAEPAPVQTQASEQAPAGAPVPAQAAAKDSARPCFTPPTALIRHIVGDSELPAMQISLGLVNFVGETEPIYPEEEAYAILPLSHDAVLEVYDLHYDGSELMLSEEPQVVRRMAAGEAYVVRVPSFGGVPARGICVVSNGRKNCWNPTEEGFNEGFLRWSRTKNLK